jgi:GAF domain-containing protein
MSEDEALMSALTELTIALLTERSLKADLNRLLRLVCRFIDGCSGASVSMMVDGKPSTVAVSDRVSLELDLAQYDAGDGPCVSALSGETIRIGYIPGEERFPHFAIGAADRRVLSSLSTPAMDHGTIVGSLNIYSHQENAFDVADERTAALFASEVTQALVKSSLFGKGSTIRDRLQEQHDEAVLVSRAEGLLMAVNECSAAQARDLIRGAAIENREEIIATAERILATLVDEPGPGVSTS